MFVQMTSTVFIAPSDLPEWTAHAASKPESIIFYNDNNYYSLSRYIIGLCLRNAGFITIKSLELKRLKPNYT